MKTWLFQMLLLSLTAGLFCLHFVVASAPVLALLCLAHLLLCGWILTLLIQRLLSSVDNGDFFARLHTLLFGFILLINALWVINASTVGLYVYGNLLKENTFGEEIVNRTTEVKIR